MKKLAVILLSVFSLIALGYFAGVWHFETHFLPGQTIQGVQVDFATASEATTEVTAAVGKTPVTLTSVDETVTTTFADLGVSIDAQGTVNELLAEQQNWFWPFSFVQVKALQVDDYTIDQTKLANALFELGLTNPEGKTAASDAVIEKTATEFVVTSESEGTILNPQQALTLAVTGLKAGQTTISLTAAQELPSVQTNELQPVVDKANRFAANAQQLIIGEETLTISQEQIFEWVYIDEAGTVGIDQSAIEAYVQALVNDYTVMATASTLNTATMQTSGGMTGSTIDVAPTVQALIKAIESGQAQTVVATLQTVSSPTQLQGVGNTYVQVSIQDQHLWYYQDGQLVLETDIITGDPTQGWDTITGVYSIMAKERDAVLEGYSYGWDYSVPVKYWMPIYSDGTGLHDASWQSTFGGEAYVGAGSHGCINLPPAVAEQLFNQISVGTPVVIYE